MKFLAGVVVANALIERLEAAAEARDASDVLEHVADDYEDSNGLDKTVNAVTIRGSSRLDRRRQGL
jgi:hypothetical protein